MMTEVVPTEPKETKWGAGYLDRSPIPDQRCYLCKFFISKGTESGNESAVVLGPVKRQGICAYFERRASPVTTSDVTSDTH